jgi:hypothetical protein
VNAANTIACDDGNACTVGDLCASGTCLPGAETACDDGNACTSDSCDKGLQCLFLPVDVTCSDGDACTVGDLCDGGLCLAGAITPCDDGNPCTQDACDATSGCMHVALAMPCDDGDPCTVGEVCAGGVCGGGQGRCAGADAGGGRGGSDTDAGGETSGADSGLRTLGADGADGGAAVGVGGNGVEDEGCRAGRAHTGDHSPLWAALGVVAVVLLRRRRGLS